MKVPEQTSDLVAFASVRIHSMVSFRGQCFLQNLRQPLRWCLQRIPCSGLGAHQVRAERRQCTIYSSPKLGMEQVPRFSMCRSQTLVNSEFVFSVQGVALILDGDFFSYKMRHANQYGGLFFFLSQSCVKSHLDSHFPSLQPQALPFCPMFIICLGWW